MHKAACRSVLNASVGALVVAASTGCVVRVGADQYMAREEKSFNVSGVPELTVATFDGSIEIRSWDRPELKVEVEKRGRDKQTAEAIEVKAEQDGSRVSIEARRASGGVEVFGVHFNRGLSARIIATVPRQTNVLARSGDGSVTVDGVRGRVELRSDDGAIRGTDLNGAIYIVTNDGSVKLDSVDGKVDVRTGDGSIVVNGKLTHVKARTDDGAVVVRAENGSAMADDWEISTGDGGVTVDLPDAFNAQVDAETGDGGIRGPLVTQVEKDPTEHRSRRSAHITLGSGGSVLRVRSGDGSIRFGRS